MKFSQTPPHFPARPPGPFGPPGPQGLYDPSFERDSCGIGFVAHLKGVASHSIVSQALEALRNLSHRGAQGCDPTTGDGAGLLARIPHEFFRQAALQTGVQLPGEGHYAIGMFFIPPGSAHGVEQVVEEALSKEGLKTLGWRTVPVNRAHLGRQATATEPEIHQLFIGAGQPQLSRPAFERKLYVARRRIEARVTVPGFSIPSFSSRTVVYKGLLLPEQLESYYMDLGAEDFSSAFALVHSRFSTNTFPTWALSHPFRYLCHNGEINTLKGNVNWMRARQGHLGRGGPFTPEELSVIFPIIRDGQSDSACLDNALEFLLMCGRKLPEALMMLVPEPWEHPGSLIDPERRAFYEYHASMMEPWDGPAALAFTDGLTIGATLDRNGLRPCRYEIRNDDTVVLASEAGVLPRNASEIRFRGRLEPGRMLLIDPAQGKLLSDDEIKGEICAEKPYAAWVRGFSTSLETVSPGTSPARELQLDLKERQRAFGYTHEELDKVLLPPALTGDEAISSMGTDTPLAVLSLRPQLFFKYFRQHFAQVTNPPIDPIREQLVMSLGTYLGPALKLTDVDGPGEATRIRLPQPILNSRQMSALTGLAEGGRVKFLQAVFRSDLETRLEELCQEAEDAVLAGAEILILTDRATSRLFAPVPSLLVVSAVHQRLVAQGIRLRTGIVCESGEPRDVHQLACLLGYGAEAIHPDVALESIAELAGSPEGESKWILAMGKGLLKIFSKMGISTLQSYCGAQIFEALGLSRELCSRYLGGTVSRLGGVGLPEIERETLERHHRVHAIAPYDRLEDGSEIHYRIQGEAHGWDPETIYTLQHATRSNDAKTFREFSNRVDNESRKRLTIRGLLDFVPVGPAVPLEEVEPASSLVKRFTTGAMSMGAIGPEAHETLAIAMNRIGGKSNTGEGGEDPARFTPDADGTSRSSAIKQVASGRFGVTSHYLVNARELQIKMAQGAKPGEGGQLPGHKVDALIARLRHSTPGVGLISPPPHHDIYSIEDLAQLIFDLKNANSEAAISVKLVSEAGVGTVAAGVAKAHADKILISGDTGGTGASPLSSIKYAGGPWELGLAETQQTLVLNGLRGRVRIETDGQLKTGRDVVVAALLGAEEFGFATAPLIVEGCIMMRKCHLNTCPAGIATLDPELRKRFSGKPEHLVNYFFFVAEELRVLMASLGFRKLSEMVGRADCLKPASGIADHWKARHLDLTPLFFIPKPREESASGAVNAAPGSAGSLDRKLGVTVLPALERGERVMIELPISNTQRAAGTWLSSRISLKHGAKGLPEDTLTLKFVGNAGQSFGAFSVPGVTLQLEGAANDYFGKGLSGAKIVVKPPRDAAFSADESILIGNTALYGATSGQAYIAGRAGERFAVRNSGARAVVEGTGDHGCEYMTGGIAVVLGRTGRNFAAGMSGGMAFVLDEPRETDPPFANLCNQAMVSLEPLEDFNDIALVREMIATHLVYTGSPKAKRILDQWQRFRLCFVKVMPLDLKKALESAELAAPVGTLAEGAQVHG